VFPCDQRSRARNQAPISKKLRAQFKNACRATDRFKKCDNVEIDDSAKFAGCEMASLESVIPQRRIIIERAALT
jgi:hypothetical protein